MPSDVRQWRLRHSSRIIDSAPDSLMSLPAENDCLAANAEATDGRRPLGAGAQPTRQGLVGRADNPMQTPGLLLDTWALGGSI